MLVALAMAGTHAPNWIVFAQTTRASFDIASVKPGSPDDPLRFRQPPGGRYLVSGASLRVLIANAYDVRDYQITGLPAWANSEKFSIEAKANATIPPWPESNKLLCAMLQSLLAERFSLALHRESHQDTIYNLVPAKTGFKLKPAAPDAPNGFEMLPNQIHSLAVPLEYLAGGLATVLRRPVYDKTGIVGKYDYRLNYTPDDATAPDPTVPTIFTALDQQLGLKLEASKGPVETIVIDRVEKLHAN
jgi:uncharacterized protein (TIGR03435 family)